MGAVGHAALRRLVRSTTQRWAGRESCEPPARESARPPRVDREDQTPKGLRMDVNTTIDIAAVKAVVVETLGVEDRADQLDAGTPLLGSMPELDSMAVLELMLALEQRFGITIEGEDVSAEVFETLGSLTEFVESKLG